MSRPRRFIVRRLALALAIAQMAAFALAPVIEGSAHASDRPSLVAPHQHGARVHQPETCLACVLLAARARTPERIVLLIAETEAVLLEAPGHVTAPSRAPPSDLRTRAPPQLAA